jgi:enoyl-CoA hydratase/carnithine racemase
MTEIKFPKFYPITKTSDDDDGSPTCKVEIRENCFLLTLTTAENTLGYKSVTALIEALTDIETYYWKEREEQKVSRYLITTGEGKKFSNGLDLESIINVGPEKFNKHVNKMFLKLLKLPIPTIAALNGHCFAAGGVSL